MSKDMTDSFVFYKTFYEQLSELEDETRLKFYDAIMKYSLLGEVPEFKGLEKAVWIPIQFAIDEAQNRRQTQIENGAKGGAPKGNQNAKRNNPKQANTSENNQEETEEQPSSTQNNPKQPNSTQFNPIQPNSTQNNPIQPKTSENNLNGNVNGNVNENVNEDGDWNVNGNVAENNPNNPPLSQSFEITSKKYAESVFEIFKNNNLPCANNIISFMQRDFKLGLQNIHNLNLNLHSDEVIQACKNYALVVNDPNCYLKSKYGFARFTEFKNFTDYLPDNFRLENFLDYKKIQKSETSTLPQTNIIYELCPHCGAKLLEWKDKLQKYECDGCKATFNYEEIHR